MSGFIACRVVITDKYRITAKMGAFVIILIFSPVLVYGNFFVTYPDEYESDEIVGDYPDPTPRPASDPDCFFHNCMYMNPNECCRDHNVHCYDQDPDPNKKPDCDKTLNAVHFCEQAKAETIHHYHGAAARVEWWRFCFNKHNISIPASPKLVSECETETMQTERQRRLCCLAANICKPLEPLEKLPEICLNPACKDPTGICCLEFNIGCSLPWCEPNNPCAANCYGKPTNYGECCEYFGNCDTEPCEFP